jgi:hypothetical protein
MVYEVHGHFSSLRKAKIPFEPNYGGPGEGPRGSFQAFFYLSGASPRESASGSSLEYQHLSQVVTHPLEPKMIVVAHMTEVATSLQPINAFQGADDPFRGPAHPRKEFIPLLLLRRYGSITPGRIDDTAKHPPASQRRLAGIFGIGAIGNYRGFITYDHLLKQARLGSAGPGQSQMPQPIAALIHGKVHIVAKVPVFAPAGPIRVGIGAGFPFAGRMGLDLDQSGVDQRAAPHNQALTIELILQQHVISIG